MIDNKNHLKDAIANSRFLSGSIKLNFQFIAIKTAIPGWLSTEG